MKKLYQDLGSWTAGQRNSFIAFATTAMLWLLPSLANLALGKGHPFSIQLETALPPGIAALCGAFLLFFIPLARHKWTPTLSWKEILHIDWGTIVLFAGGIALGTMMLDTGLADVLGKALMSSLGTNHVAALIGVSITTSTVLSELASNTAAANMVIPVMISMAPAEQGLSIALGATLGASLGFMLPVSTPAVAIIHGSGAVRMKDMIKAGVLVDITGILIIWGFLTGILPLIAAWLG